MFVSIILDTEYMGMGGRIKWFLKNLSSAKRNGIFIITHEHFRTNYHELCEGCADRFYSEFEMRKIDEEEYDSIRKGFIPDKLFENIETEYETRTRAILYLSQNRYLNLEKCLINLIDNELKQRDETRVEGIFNCCECFESIRFLGQYYHCSIIPYSFSAIRKVHGYQWTLYTVNMNGIFYTDAESKKRYKEYLDIEDIPVYSYRELLVLFGKEHNIPLIKYIDYIPEYEAGICEEAFHINPNSFSKFPTTDDDLYYECDKHFKKNQIVVRKHPIQYSQMGISRENVKNDPASFILSCRRIIGTQSQILLKGMLWKRAVYMKGGTLPFSFLCSKDIENVSPVDIKGLNFYMFCYLVPDYFMFDVDYWRWRLKGPTEKEIYEKHFLYYLHSFNLDINTMCSNDEEKRFVYLLNARNCDKDIIHDLTTPNNCCVINYSVAMSKIDIIDENGNIKSKYRCNSFSGQNIYSIFNVNIKDVSAIRFFPFIDVAGSAWIDEILLNGKSIVYYGKVVYFPKTNGFIEWKNVTNIDLDAEIKFVWSYKK